jgi:hypothetical protein
MAARTKRQLLIGDEEVVPFEIVARALISRHCDLVRPFAVHC